MSDEPEDEPYKVGYGKPPKEHQFQPKETGNRKGRPKKRQLALTPREMRRMVLEVGMMEVPVPTAKGVKMVPAAQAVYLAMIKKAIGGQISSQRTFLEDFGRAMREHTEIHERYFAILERSEMMATLGLADEKALKDLEDQRKLTRKNTIFKKKR